MRSLELKILAPAYEISLDGEVLARLDAGPQALLAGAGTHLRDADIEAAIASSRTSCWCASSFTTAR